MSNRTHTHGCQKQDCWGATFFSHGPAEEAPALSRALLDTFARHVGQVLLGNGWRAMRASLSNGGGHCYNSTNLDGTMYCKIILLSHVSQKTPFSHTNEK